MMLLLLLLAAPPESYDRFSDKHAEVECNSCHLRSKANEWEHVRFPKKNHKPCESSGCHPGQLVKFDPRKPKYCRTCHVAGPGGRGINIHKVVYPPYRKGEETQWGLASSNHAAHIETGKCETCHVANAKDRTPDMIFTGHSGCATCHGEKEKPLMSDCKSCHLKKAADTALASGVATPYRVTKRFTHAGHAEKSKKDECSVCHANAKVPKGKIAPLPSMADCTTCHDGDQAFDAVGSTCRRCHESNEKSALPELAKNATFFSHGRHSDRNVVGAGGAYGCNECHPTTDRGRLFFPAGGKDFDPKKTRNGHWPCAKCHQNQFLTRDHKGICIVCHEHVDPGRDNPIKEAFREERELVSDLPHDKHQKTECDRCHFEQSGAEPPKIAGSLLAPGHELCSQCHETHKTSPMTKCGACHRSLAPNEQRTKWAVNQKFTHDTHQVDVRTAKVVNASAIGWKRVEKSSAQKLQCAVCHTGIDTGERPKMKSCHTCHDGTFAFKDTGHECTRCHGPVQEKGS
jgi:hypothetical protein